MESNSVMLTNLIPLIPALLLGGFVINGIGFRLLPKAVAGIVGCLTVITAFVLSLVVFNSFDGNATVVTLFPWIELQGFKVNMAFQVDQLSLIMLLLVTGVGSLIHIYSWGYMSHDEGFGKFFAFLNLFVFSMLLLVLGSNFLIMFIGWEGVGLCSYLLIGFWNKNVNYANAARKAFIMNRIGDLGFLLAIFTIMVTFGTLEYTEVFAQASMLQASGSVVLFITACLFIGAMGKSAQIPLYTWLPDAMAGPTPVSALIHAATMVTAGIYMVIRANVLFVLAPEVLHVVSYIGVATALLAASIGLFQNDIKKVLAYSTVSQLGLMFLGLGSAAFVGSMFHVLTHAFFKALLFLGAGSVIHAIHDEQDIRKMGGLTKALPITFITFLIGTIAISGIPPFAGFFSKDEILASVYAHDKVLWVMGLGVSLMTSFYMFRLLFLTFGGAFRGTEHQKKHLHESPLAMTFPLMVLAVLAMVGGLMGLPEVISPNHMLAEFMDPLFMNAKALVPSAFEHHMDHSTEWMLMGISLGVALAGLVLAFAFFGGGKNVPAADEQITNPLVKLIYNKYYIDELYDVLFVKPIKVLSVLLYFIAEFLVIDLVVNLVGFATTGFGSLTKRLQTGAVGTYMLAMVICMVVFLFWQLRPLLF